MRDLGGKVMLPAFVDGHGRSITSLELSKQVNVSNPPVGPANGIPSTIAALAAFQAAQKSPRGQGIIGRGDDRNGLRVPTAYRGWSG